MSGLKIVNEWTQEYSRRNSVTCKLFSDDSGSPKFRDNCDPWETPHQTDDGHGPISNMESHLPDAMGRFPVSDMTPPEHRSV